LFRRASFPKSHRAKQRAFVRQIVCIYWNSKSMGRHEAKEIVEKLGGTVNSSVTRKTTYVIAGQDVGSKLVKAKSAGIQVISEDEFLKLIGRQML